MNDKEKEKEKEKEVSPFEPKITFSGAGVLHISSTDLVKTKQAKRQIKALGELTKKKGFLASA